VTAEQRSEAAPVVAQQVPVVNVANGLTLVRIGLIPAFVILFVASGMVLPGWQIAAGAAFLLASVTDYVDGWVARSMNQVTAFGKVADPIADKALTGTALVLLSTYGQVAWWVTVVVLARELGITAIRFWVIRHGVIAASRGGKVKTTLQILAIAWYVFPFPPVIADAAPWMMGAAVVVTVVTGLDYVLRAVRLRRRPDGAAAPDRSAAAGGPGAGGPAERGPGPDAGTGR